MPSQNNEDQIISGVFGDYTGHFLDIGAGDGQYLSNTDALIQRGWSGVLVEPSLRNFTKLQRCHGNNPKLTLVNALVGHLNTWGFSKFWEAKDPIYSTTEKANLNKWATVGFDQPYSTPLVPLYGLLSAFPGPLDFVSIDTEGTSVDLFCGWPFWHSHPRLFCVEHDGMIDRCMERIASLGYSLISSNAENILLERRPDVLHS